MPPTYKERPLLKAQERSRLQQGIDQLEGVYEQIDSFTNGSSEPPAWALLLSRFRAALDFVKADAAILDTGGT